MLQWQQYVTANEYRHKVIYAAFAASLLLQLYLRFWDLPHQAIHAVNREFSQFSRKPQDVWNECFLAESQGSQS